MLEVIPEPNQARKMERAFQAERVVEIKAWWHESGQPCGAVTLSSPVLLDQVLGIDVAGEVDGSKLTQGPEVTSVLRELEFYSKDEERPSPQLSRAVMWSDFKFEKIALSTGGREEEGFMTFS